MELTHHDLLNEQHRQIAEQATETVRRLIGAALLNEVTKEEL